jgi:hypothetical protein
MAEILGVEPRLPLKIENGKKHPSLRALKMIAAGPDLKLQGDIVR